MTTYHYTDKQLSFPEAIAWLLANPTGAIRRKSWTDHEMVGLQKSILVATVDAIFTDWLTGLPRRELPADAEYVTWKNGNGFVRVAWINESHGLRWRVSTGESVGNAALLDLIGSEFTVLVPKP